MKLLLAALILSAQAFAAAAAPPDPLTRRVDELITSQHFHGMPEHERRKVRALGPEALPILRARLHDPAFLPHKTKICSVIGISGEPGGFHLLREVVWDPGEVLNPATGSPRNCTTELVAQSAMGFIAKGSDEALHYLQRSTNPAFWDSLPWYCTDSKDTRSNLVEVSVIALSVSERSEARAFLVELSKSGTLASLARRAVTRFDEIRELGYDEYRRRGGPRY